MQTSEGDLDLSTGQLEFVSDETEEIAQRLRNRLYLGKGEWFLDTDQGIPYVQFILGALTPSDVPAVRRMFSRVISETPGIDFVLSCELVPGAAPREWNLEFKAKAVTGDVIVGGPGDRFIVERA